MTPTYPQRRNRIALAGAVLCALALLVPPAPADAQTTGQRLDDARRRATAVKSEYQRLAEAFAQADRDVDRAQAQINETEADINRTRSEIDGLQDRLKDRVRTAYRMRGIGFFHFLLEADSFRDFNTRLVSLQRQTLQDEDLILQLRRKRSHLESRQAELSNQKRAFESQRASYREQANRVTISLQQASQLIKQLEGQLAQEEIARLFRISRAPARGGTSVPLAACPVDPPNVVTDSFGAPRGGGARRHQGNDIMAPHGTPIRAVNDGTITRTGSGGLGGLSVYLWDGANEYYYAHLASIAVSPGQRVSAGAYLGGNGDTGNARGGPPHLHFEIHPGGGRAIDPYPSLSRVC